MGEMLELKEFEGKLLETHQLLETFIEKANGEFETAGSAASETKSAVEKLSEQCIEYADRIAELEQRVTKGGDDDPDLDDSIGEQFVKSDSWAAMVDGRQNTARMGGLSLKTAIVNATGQNQPLVPADRRAGIIHEPNRVLHMRDLLRVSRTSSNLIEYAKENVFTNNAGPQVANSPEEFENVTKPESGITFTLATAAVRTLAHWIPASKQVLSDSPMLESYINGRLMYGLKLKEDTQILLGTGANGELPGLYTNRTAYSVTSPLSYEPKPDIIRDAMRQAENAEYAVTAIILHTTDWAEIELLKDTDGRYIVGDPHMRTAPRLWGVPVMVTNSIAAGTFLVGAFDMAAELWDREDATIEVSRENSDNFVKNMCTILAEERLALTIYRAAALIGGSFSVT